MTRLLIYITLFCLATLAASAQPFDTCKVSATFYGQDLRPDSVCVDVVRIVKDGNLWSTRLATYCTDSAGYLEIPLPRSSVAYLYSDKARSFMGPTTGKPVSVPNAATAALTSITPATAPPPQYIIALPGSGDTSETARYVDSNRVQKGFVTLSKVYQLISAIVITDTSGKDAIAQIESDIAGIFLVLGDTASYKNIINSMRVTYDAHIANTSNPHAVTAAQTGAVSQADYNAFLADLAIDQHVQDSTLAAEVAALAAQDASLAVDDDTLQGRLNAHIARTDNPHNVTPPQIGAVAIGGGTLADSILCEGTNINLVRTGNRITINSVVGAVALLPDSSIFEGPQTIHRPYDWLVLEPDSMLIRGEEYVYPDSISIWGYTGEGSVTFAMKFNLLGGFSAAGHYAGFVIIADTINSVKITSVEYDVKGYVGTDTITSRTSFFKYIWNSPANMTSAWTENIVVNSSGNAGIGGKLDPLKVSGTTGQLAIYHNKNNGTRGSSICKVHYTIRAGYASSKPIKIVETD